MLQSPLRALAKRARVTARNNTFVAKYTTNVALEQMCYILQHIYLHIYVKSCIFALEKKTHNTYIRYEKDYDTAMRLAEP